MKLRLWAGLFVLFASCDAVSAEGEWRLEPHWTDEAGAHNRFYSCSASTSRQAGTVLTILLDEQNGWSVWLQNDSWRLPEGKSYPLQLHFDGSPPLSVRATALSAFKLEAVLGMDATAATFLKRAHILRVRSGTFDEEYDLEGSSEAVDAVKNCVATSLEDEQRRFVARRTAGTIGTVLASVGAVVFGPNPALIPVLEFAYQVGQRPNGWASASVAIGEVHVTQTAPKLAVSPPSDSTAPSGLERSSETVVSLVQRGGVFEVPVMINGKITLDFIVDSGASDVTIPADVFGTLVRTGTIEGVDLLHEQDYQLADGSTSTAQVFRIRSLGVGDTIVEDVIGSVTSADGPLLLGQTFLSRFKSWSMDYANGQLTLYALE